MKSYPNHNPPSLPTAGTRHRQENKLRSAVWLALATALMLASMCAQHSRATTLPDTAETGRLYFRSETKPDSTYSPAVHLKTRVQFDIQGLTAKAVVHQRFTNTTGEWVEGVYVFPLPENSAVNFMQMTIGARTITGVVKEKQEAKRIYDQAKKTGHKAALVEQERPNLFTQSVANIAPGETIEVQLHYLETVRFDQGAFSMRFPMTLTPRYIPGVLAEGELQEQSLSASSLGWAQATEQVPDAHRITPRYLPGGLSNPVEVQVQLHAGVALEQVMSTTHRLQIREPHVPTGTYNLSLPPGTEMDRDFHLQWRPADAAQATAAVFHELRDGDSYVQLMLLPPHTEATATLPRELTLVIDVSGSMQGPSIDQAKRSVLWALDQLKPQDSFNLIAFESNFRMLYNKPLPATPAHLAQARRFVRILEANGGTEMAPALQAALSQRNSETTPDALRQVVFITDGSVGNEAALFKLIDEMLGNTRLFTVGIGAAPNSYFMRKAAEFGRGTFTHIGDTNEVDSRMGELFAKLSHPVMASVDVRWPGNTAAAFPSKVPDLYLGEPLLVNAKLDGNVSGQEISVFGQIGNTSWRRYIKVPAASNEAENAVVATHWARAKIETLLDEKLRGRDAEQVRTDVLKVALPFQLMSPYTSFVAVEEIPSRPLDAALAEEGVLNQLPHGQQAPALMYPQTATPGRLNLLSGLLALLSLLVIRRGLGDA